MAKPPCFRHRWRVPHEKRGKDLAFTAVLELLAENAYLVFDSCLVGNQCEKVAERYAAINDIRSGDLVLEISTRRRKPAIMRLGFLLGKGHSKNLGKIYYVLGFNNKVWRWHNCWFIRVLDLNIDRNIHDYNDWTKYGSLRLPDISDAKWKFKDKDNADMAYGWHKEAKSSG